MVNTVKRILFCPPWTSVCLWKVITVCKIYVQSFTVGVKVPAMIVGQSSYILQSYVSLLSSEVSYICHGRHQLVVLIFTLFQLLNKKCLYLPHLPLNKCHFNRLPVLKSCSKQPPIAVYTSCIAVNKLPVWPAAPSALFSSCFAVNSKIVMFRSAL